MQQGPGGSISGAGKVTPGACSPWPFPGGVGGEPILQQLLFKQSCFPWRPRPQPRATGQGKNSLVIFTFFFVKSPHRE